MPDKRFAKIICTLGPASSDEKMLVAMAAEGMNVVRLNFSHADADAHLQKLNIVRRINRENNFDIKILQDLEGYRIRIGHLADNILLDKGSSVFFSNKNDLPQDFIPFDYTGNLLDIARDTDIFIDDGKIHLRVTEVSKDFVKAEVLYGGILKQRKGINIPSLKLEVNAVTDKDRKDIEFGVANAVDFVAQSFVRNKFDIIAVNNLVRTRNPSCKIIAKIENKEGIDNLDEIIDNCDGIMIARGDLGVSLPIYKIPIIQKHIIRHCIRKKKYVITATQMLESMTEEIRPTRAEVADVANAVLDGTDYVMLSGETAVGRHPDKVVAMMREIINFTEGHLDAIGNQND